MSPECTLKSRGAWTPCEPNRQAPYLPVFINHFLSKPFQNRQLLTALFVERKWSARQIAQFTGWSKTSIIEALSTLGITRPQKVHFKASFGWKVSEEGNLVPHVREQKVVRQIVQLSAKGLSATSIAKFLNEKQVPTKTRKMWEHKTIIAILNRESLRRSENYDRESN